MRHIRSTLGATVLGAVTALSFSAGAMTAAPAVPAAASTAVGASAVPVAKPQPAIPTRATRATTTLPPSATTASQPRHRAPELTSESTTKRTAATQSRPKHRASSSGAGCGQRAVTAGVFNPSCSEYQGYLDPGRSAGRAPSSSDIQGDWAACTAVKSDVQCRRELN